MRRILALILFATVMAQPAWAASCGNTAAGFNAWLSGFKRQMIGRGFSRQTVASSLNRVTYDRRVIRLDRGQRNFKQSFEKFYRRRTKGMVPIARRRMKQYRRTFARIEKVYGVPAAILASIWGLETAFGHFMGKKSILRSLATLAYDCRRSTFFTKELIAALTIVQRGHMRPGDMIGAWAGEIGHTQFLATRYVKYAVSFDGDRVPDLYRSVPDALASTAAWFKGNGWQRGRGWQPGTVNYDVIKKWNRASVYQKTIATLASVLARK
jgi:lytic murein transglycosylase